MVKIMATMTSTVLHGNAAGAPTFGAVALTTDVSGTLPVGNGGTGATTLASNGVVYGNGTSAVGVTAAPSANNVLVSTGGAPAFQTLATDATLQGNGVGTSFGLKLSNANTWTGTQTLGGAALTASTPTALAANTNDWALSASNSYFLISASTPVNVTGIASPAAGRVIVLVNTGSSAITIVSDDGASSTAANRFKLQGGSNVILAADGTATFIYDGTATRWRMISGD